MRPPILQWKVMLTLLAVVIAGASLGSALHSTGTSPRTFSTYGVNSVQAMTTVEAGHLKCGNVKAEIRQVSPALRPYLRRELRRICQSHG